MATALLRKEIERLSVGEKQIVMLLEAGWKRDDVIADALRVDIDLVRSARAAMKMEVPSFRVEQMRMMWEAGYQAKDIGDVLGLTATQVLNLRKRLGLRPRPTNSTR